MADKKDKFADIQEVLDYFDDKWKKLSEVQVANYKQMQSNAIKANAKEEEEHKLYLERKIFDMQAEGLLTSKKQASKYIKKLEEERAKRKLESELYVLKELSKEEQSKREIQTKILEKEKKLQTEKNRGNQTAAKRVQKELDILKKEESLTNKKEAQKDRAQRLKDEGAAYEFGDTFKDIFQPLKDEMAKGNVLKRTADQNLTSTFKGMVKALKEGLNAINTSISEYAKYQTAINARLQGSNGDAVNVFGGLVNKLDDVAFSPLIAASDLYSNLNSLVGQGIVTNVEQRAFFETIKGGIATTFDVTSESLNRMIRLQRVDSTAARLGMEGYLTRFLNTYVENTEYLQSTFDNVASSLFEASAALGGLPGKGTAASLEFEYVVQKWLGTLTGIGLSNEAAQSIATALGQLGSGNVDVLNSQMGTLLTMSASNVGKNIGDILNKGLDADTTNKLLGSMVTYLKTIAGEGTNVTKAELAKVFGVSISDLVAVAQMDQAAINTITDDLLSYGGMYTELRNQFNQLPSRMGISNILENLFSNLTYQTGMSIAGNPASYAMWKITDLIQGVTGGINIPFITALGTGVDLNATVENLMKIGLVGANMLGNIGSIINGVKSIGKGDILLDKLGVSAGTGEIKKFGAGLSLTQGNFRTSGLETSQLTYIGQEDSDAYYNSTLNAQKSASEKKLKTEISNQEENNPTVKILTYLSTEVKLKDNVIALTNAATSTYKILEKLNTETAGITSALSLINKNLMGSILPAIGKSTFIGFGGTLVGTTAVIPLTNLENTSINNTVTTASTVSAPSPIIDYFNSIRFEEGFISIVDNLMEINRKIPAGLGSGGSSIEGLTQSGRSI